MEMVTKREYAILEKYSSNGALVPDQHEKNFVAKMVSMGYMTPTKFTRPEHPEKVKLTENGEKLFRRERIRTSRLLRSLHSSVHEL